MDANAHADVLLLGTYHMANPGRDVIRFEADDVLAFHRQAELEELVARLAQFRPTKVCVERPPEHQPKLDDAYGQYVEGRTEPDRDEIQQVGFRLARLCGLSRVYGIDDHTPLEWDELNAYLAEHPDEDERQREKSKLLQAEFDKKAEELARTTISEFLLSMNDERALRRDAGWYVDAAGLGGVGEQAGATMLTSWYRRNIRIFSNLSGLTEPGDRIFVVFGSGHIPILRDLVRLSSRHNLVEASTLL